FMSRSPIPGVIFATVLLLVMVITNVPMRGMWSVVIIVIILATVIILSLISGAWEWIFEKLSNLSIHLNGGGYLFISLILFAIWLVTFLFFDKQIYVVVTPGQVRVCEEIGGGEQVYSTQGITFQKKRSDLFRHWILGFGSGDLIINVTGAKPH